MALQSASLWLPVTVLTALLLGAVPAQADNDQAALAEALFRSGKALMAEKHFEEACPKLQESYRLDSATGTLLALGLCREAQGKTATAWVHYSEAAARAQREGNVEREQAARQRAQALESTLSRLVIVLSPGISHLAGLEVRRDGLQMPPASLGLAVPVDPGEHRIEAAAAGKVPFAVVVQIKPSGDQQSVVIPELRNAAPIAPAVPMAPKEKAPSAYSDRKAAGWVIGAAGIIGLGVGSYYGLQAMHHNRDSRDDCDGNACGPEGKASRNQAISDANRATVSFLVGGALTAVGAALVLWPPKSVPESPSISIQPSAGPSGLGCALQGEL